MIQFNLLPDVKLEFIRAKRMKRTIITLSLLVVAASTGVVLILVGTVYGWQRTRLNNLTDDIAAVEQQIKDIEQIDRVLTVQNQLSAIDGLHDEKPVTTRLFNYLERLTPSNVSIARIDVSFEQSSVTMSGSADSIAAINKFVDTLKFVDFTVVDSTALNAEEATDSLIQSDSPASRRIFSNVVLRSFGLATNSSASYTIDMVFDQDIFDSRLGVTLLLPDKITTRSELEKPTALFSEPEIEGEE